MELYRQTAFVVYDKHFIIGLGHDQVGDVLHFMGKVGINLFFFLCDLYSESKPPEVIVLLNALAMKGTSSGSSYLQFSYDIESGPGLFRFCWDCITMFQSMMEK